MSDIWNGNSLADAIGRELERKGFAPFGVGVPHVAADVARLWFGDQIDRLTALADKVAGRVARVEALTESATDLDEVGLGWVSVSEIRAALDGFPHAA